MDFFTAQDQARKATRLLVVCYSLAVLLIAALVHVLLSVAFNMPVTNLETALFFFGGTIGIILLTSFFKTMALGGHGGKVAKDLGGRLIDPDTRDPDERRLLNVVEEMAIASGIPVPEAYILDNEEGINAFAAGSSVSEAAVGFTRGAVQTLSRDELQGVMAHEFSHILNGDMRLNMRLIGILFGILALSIIGRVLLYSGRGARVRVSGGGRGRDGGGGIMLVGLGLIIIGSIGVFFSRLIQAGISRQREFLADAAAVQFTRNPAGISGALQKIGSPSRGSRMASPKAEEASHMFFSMGLKSDFGSLFATHPPLPERIKRIDPSWDGTFRPLEDMPSARAEPTPPPKEQKRAGDGIFPPIFGQGTEDNFGRFAAQLGMLGGGQLEDASRTIRDLPEGLANQAHKPDGSRALIAALLLSTDPKVRETQEQSIRSIAGDAVWQQALQLGKETSDQSSHAKITAVELAMPALRQLPKETLKSFLDLLDQLVKADGNISLFEFMIQRMVRRHLATALHQQREKPPKYRSLKGRENAVELLLSTLAAIGSDNEEERQMAFETGAADLASELKRPLKQQAIESDTLQRIDVALLELEQSTARVKRMLLLACAHTVMANNKLNDHEAELLRAIADGVGTPIPPIVSNLA